MPLHVIINAADRSIRYDKKTKQKTKTHIISKYNIFVFIFHYSLPQNMQFSTHAIKLLL